MMAGSQKYLGKTLWNGLLEQGGRGVDIFFVISGFIIAVIALERPDFKPSLSRRSFAIKRFSRIIPLMWIAIVSHFSMRWILGSPELVLSHYLRAFFLYPSGLVEPSPIWTLRHELIFYLVFALTFMGRSSLRLVMGLWVIMPFLLELYKGTLGAERDDIHLASIIFSNVNLEFGVGLITGLYWLRKSPAADLHPPVHSFLTIGALTFSVIVLGAFLPVARYCAIDAAVMAVASAALVWLSTRVHCSRGGLSRFGRLLGDASYAIYLFHLHCVAIFLIVFSRAMPNGNLGLIFSMIVIACVVLGVLVHLWLERPLVGVVQRWLGPKPAIPPIVARA